MLHGLCFTCFLLCEWQLPAFGQDQHGSAWHFMLMLFPRDSDWVPSRELFCRVFSPDEEVDIDSRMFIIENRSHFQLSPASQSFTEWINDWGACFDGAVGDGTWGTREVLGSDKDSRHLRFYVLRAKNFKGSYRTINWDRLPRPLTICIPSMYGCLKAEQWCCLQCLPLGGEH